MHISNDDREARTDQVFDLLALAQHELTGSPNLALRDDRLFCHPANARDALKRARDALSDAVTVMDTLVAADPNTL